MSLRDRDVGTENPGTMTMASPAFQFLSALTSFTSKWPSPFSRDMLTMGFNFYICILAVETIIMFYATVQEKQNECQGQSLTTEHV